MASFIVHSRFSYRLWSASIVHQLRFPDSASSITICNSVSLVPQLQRPSWSALVTLQHLFTVTRLALSVGRSEFRIYGKQCLHIHVIVRAAPAFVRAAPFPVYMFWLVESLLKIHPETITSYQLPATALDLLSHWSIMLSFLLWLAESVILLRNSPQHFCDRFHRCGTSHLPGLLFNSG